MRGAVMSTYRTLCDVTEIATGKVTVAHLHCVEDSLRRMPSLRPDFHVTPRDDEAGPDEACACAGCPAFDPWKQRVDFTRRYSH